MVERAIREIKFPTRRRRVTASLLCVCFSSRHQKTISVAQFHFFFAKLFRRKETNFSGVFCFSLVSFQTNYHKRQTILFVCLFFLCCISTRLKCKWLTWTSVPDWHCSFFLFALGKCFRQAATLKWNTAITQISGKMFLGFLKSFVFCWFFSILLTKGQKCLFAQLWQLLVNEVNVKLRLGCCLQSEIVHSTLQHKSLIEIHWIFTGITTVLSFFESENAATVQRENRFKRQTIVSAAVFIIPSVYYWAVQRLQLSEQCTATELPYSSRQVSELSHCAKCPVCLCTVYSLNCLLQALWVCGSCCV